MGSGFQVWLALSLYVVASQVNPISCHAPIMLPIDWDSICTFSVNSSILGLYVNNVATKDNVLDIQCHVDGNVGKIWQFQTFRSWSVDLLDVTVFLQVTCTNEGHISLPWPMKAHGLVGLKVSNCFMTNKYADFGDRDVAKMAEQLRVLELRDSVWVSDGSDFTKVSSPAGLANLSADYDCGQDSTIEYMVTCNVSDQIVTKNASGRNKDSQVGLENSAGGGDDSADLLWELFPGVTESEGEMQQKDLKSLSGKADMLGSENSNPILSEVFTQNASDAENDFLDLLNRVQSLDIKCNYEHLQVLDESSAQVMPIVHFTVMLQGSRYPQLRIMNYSRSGIREIPRELQDFRVNFPKLEYLDLSRNYLTHVELSNVSQPVKGPHFTLDVRYNRITKIAIDNITSWAKLDRVFVDIRENPIHCDCQVEQLSDFIQFGEFHENLAQYDYIRNLKCASPAHLKGQRISTLDVCKTGSTAQSARQDGGGSVSSTVGIVIGCLIFVVIILVISVVIVIRVRATGHRGHVLKEDTSESKPSISSDTRVDLIQEKTREAKATERDKESVNSEVVDV